MKNCAFFLLISMLFSFGNNSLGQSSILTKKLDSLKTVYELRGLSITIIKNNKIIYTKGFGQRDIARNLPVDDSTKYRIASISKFFASIAMMQLYEQGKFDLDADVSRYLGFTFRNPKFPNDSISIRRILSHCAGLRDGDTYSDFLTASYSSPVPSIQQLFVPGGAYYSANMWSNNNSAKINYFTYSNANFGVAGSLVEKLSGERFDVYCRKHIFIPLGLTCSYNIQDLPNINDVATIYRKINGVWTANYDSYSGIMPAPRDLSSYILGSNGFIFAPQGGLRVSSLDLAKATLAIMNNGVLNGKRILNDTTVQVFLKSNWKYTGSNGDNYYGIFNEYAFGNHTTKEFLPGETLIGHPGEAYGLISDMYYSPSKSYAIVFITNGGSWGDGKYSGWYNIEEDMYKTCFSELNNLTTGINKGLNSAPEQFKLEQCFPNPFNPSTNISFKVPFSSNVILKIYDIMGKEISTLVNEEKKPGNYVVNYNSSGISSGVYFYNLRADNFSETRQMILLK